MKIYSRNWVCILIRIELVNSFWLIEMRLLENSLVLNMGLTMMNFACFSNLHNLVWILGVSTHQFHWSLF